MCCQRIGIMAHGGLKCIGTSALLRSKYGSGYDLEIMFKSPQKSTMFAESILPKDWSLVKSMNRMRTYNFLPKPAELAHIFFRMYQDAEKNGIYSWGLKQSTLDDVFANIVTDNDS